MRHQGLERVEHVPITQIPAGGAAAVHGAIIEFGGSHDAGILFGIEIGLAIAASSVPYQRHAALEQVAKLPHNCGFARREHALRHRTPIMLRLRLPRREASIASPCFDSGRGRMCLQIVDDGVDGFAKAVDV